MNPVAFTPVPDAAVPRSRHIDSQLGEEYSILSVLTRDTRLFLSCVTHDIKIGRGDYSKQLVIHAQGEAPVVGAPVKRKRLGGNGIALIWANRTGRVTGGGFTTAAVPADWRQPTLTVEFGEVK
jgi:hypothetical protein